jgi:hypothetical protein
MDHFFFLKHMRVPHCVRRCNAPRNKRSRLLRNSNETRYAGAAWPGLGKRGSRFLSVDGLLRRQRLQCVAPFAVWSALGSGNEAIEHRSSTDATSGFLRTLR